MSVFASAAMRVLVQGVTGREGWFHTQQMRAYGTQVVAGVTPGRGGETREGVPIFDSVAEAVASTGAQASVIFVPAPHAAEAIVEAVLAGLSLAVAITEGIPVLDMVRVMRLVHEHPDFRLIGPNCPGLLVTGQTKLGIMPARIFTPGSVGVVSRSGTLTYEVVAALSAAGIGQSSAVGIGGDPIIGTRFTDTLAAFATDPDTSEVVLLGEIGGDDEEKAAELIAAGYDKPVVAFISGLTAPVGKRMGHAGAIISGTSGTPQAKVEAMRSAGVTVAETLEGLVTEVARARSVRA